MSDLTQLINDPALCAQLQTFNPAMFVGLAGAPAIEQAVQYLKEQWALSTKLAPIAAILLGIATNVGLAVYLDMSLGQAALIGALTGAAASGIHIVKD